MRLVVALLLVTPAAWAEVGTCFTSETPATEPAAADCGADEPDCSTLPDSFLPPASTPAGPRCLEAGATCRPASPALAAGSDGPPFVEPLRIRAPRWRPSLLPEPSMPPHRAVRLDHDEPPPVPPPRA